MKNTACKERRTAQVEQPPAAEPHEATLAEIHRLLAPLCIAATVGGDAKAGFAIINLATSLCNEVADFVCSHKAAADAIARARVTWPICVSKHPEFRARNLRYMDVLPLGEASGWQPIGRKAYSVSTPVSTAVYGAVASIQTDRSLRGESAKDPTFAEVFSRIERIFGKVENSPTLRPLGLSFANGKRDTCPPGSRSYESNVRAGIRDRLRKAFRAMFTFPDK